jgi:putative Ca2+/H+ antiporter (TMEM165/GDT1 family)
MRSYVFAAALVLAAAAQAVAQVATQQTRSSTVTLADIGMFIYPAEGQSPEQQQADEEACTQWAEAQTGLVLQPGSVDTQAAADAAQQEAADETQGAAVAGAARGALAGVAIGAIAGDAGTGAAIGAVAGGIRGRRTKKAYEAEAAQQGAAQAEASSQAAIDEFKKAAGVCLEGRGYTVQ